MIIEQPGDESSEITAMGNPWHGLSISGNLDTLIGVNRSWVTPDTGDCFIVKAPSTPAVSRTVDQLAYDASHGHQWRDYATLSGWNYRQLYGRGIAGGKRSWVYCASIGDSFSVNASGLTIGWSGIVGSITLKSLKLGPPQTITHSIPLTTFPGITNAEFYDLLDFTEDGSSALIGVWRGADDYGSITYGLTADEHGMAAASAATAMQLAGNYCTIPPHAYLRLDISKTAATLTVLKSGEAQLKTHSYSPMTVPEWFLYLKTTIVSVSPTVNSTVWEQSETALPDTEGTFGTIGYITRDRQNPLNNPHPGVYSETTTDVLYVGAYFSGASVTWITITSTQTHNSTFSYNLPSGGASPYQKIVNQTWSHAFSLSTGGAANISSADDTNYNMPAQTVVSNSGSADFSLDGNSIYSSSLSSAMSPNGGIYVAGYFGSELTSRFCGVAPVRLSNAAYGLCAVLTDTIPGPTYLNSKTYRGKIFCQYSASQIGYFGEVVGLSDILSLYRSPSGKVRYNSETKTIELGQGAYV